MRSVHDALTSTEMQRGPTCYRMVVLTSWDRSMTICYGTAPIVINQLNSRMTNDKWKILFANLLAKPMLS